MSREGDKTKWNCSWMDEHAKLL